MASDENSNMLCYDDYDHDDTDDGYYDHQLPHQHNLSRLSVCTSSMYTNEDDDYQDCDGMKMFMSRLSIESFDADGELSDDEKEGVMSMLDLSSDSDKESGCYSLPATPPRQRNRGVANHIGVKDYASENEAQKGKNMKKNMRMKRRVIRERWLDSDNNNKSKKKEEESVGAGMGMGNYNGYAGNSFSGESESGGVMVITRPKGGKRSLCMDLDEVKACRDLGFELEHERMLEMPSRVSVSGSTLDTSSGGNSPIANFRISSPGDDPRDVKARLKVWAQAVALASASKHGCL